MFEEKYINEKMSSLACLKNSYSVSCKSTDFGEFWLRRSTFKVDFLIIEAEFGEILETLVREGRWE